MNVQGITKTLLWLDDVRDPSSNFGEWLIFSPIGRDVKVVWVKTYFEFVKWIKENGLPDAICFDHDLGKNTEKELLAAGYSKKEARKLKKEEKTGYDCAKWLVEYCLDRGRKVPAWGLQTSNPAGRDNIDALLKNYNKTFDD